MLFSSLIFLYIFLPVTLLLYYFTPRSFRNYLLFVVSIIFFAWGGVSYSFLLIFSILFNYLIGLAIGKRPGKRAWLILGITLNLLLLVTFKYANFIIDNLNAVFSWLSLPAINNPAILLPIGISFYTFQALSYLVDVYRKTCDPQKNFFNLGLYISLFPQLIAGPIVRYHDIQAQLKSRTHTLDKFRSGVLRFALGFGKKVIIANTMASMVDEIFKNAPEGLSPALSWIGILAYSMQIYYDFSGYSDMAIGLGRMFGFEILENFNFPYISRSIKEFWRRWHISLSNWFRDYLYIPLGGNRISRKRTVINLLIVFFVTGFWHGASWNFLAWGLVHGFFLVLERTSFSRLLNRLPAFLQHSYTWIIVLASWVLFRADTLEYAIGYYGSMMGFGHVKSDPFLLYQVLNRESIVIFIIAITGAFGVFQKLYDRIQKNNPLFRLLSTKVIDASWTSLEVLFVIIVILYGTGELVMGAYNPFIYFRF